MVLRKDVSQELETTVAERLASTFRVLGDPTRLRILWAIAGEEQCVGDLASDLGLSQSAISHQLRLLRNLRLVKSRRAGRSVLYSLDDAHIERLFQEGLDHVNHW